MGNKNAQQGGIAAVQPLDGGQEALVVGLGVQGQAKIQNDALPFMFNFNAAPADLVAAAMDADFHNHILEFILLSKNAGIFLQMAGEQQDSNYLSWGPHIPLHYQLQFSLYLWY